MRVRGLLLLLLLPLISCGGGANATLFVRLASDITPQVMQSISNGMNTIYRGIYFEYRELKCPPQSIYDYADPSGDPILIYPESTQPGLDPAQDEFIVDTSTLKANAFYSVRMVAATIQPVATPPYEGISDCPLFLDIGQMNRVVICFGNGGSATRTCQGTTPVWENCPAPTSVACE